MRSTRKYVTLSSLLSASRRVSASVNVHRHTDVSFLLVTGQYSTATFQSCDRWVCHNDRLHYYHKNIPSFSRISFSNPFPLPHTPVPLLLNTVNPPVPCRLAWISPSEEQKNLQTLEKISGYFPQRSPFLELHTTWIAVTTLFTF